MKIIELKSNELRQLQLIELEMLIEVDRICRKHGINYSLAGGTLIGAVRHGGFIPWDDDLDIIFLHEDYEKFVKICETELDTDRFFLQDYRTDPGYRWGYGKLRRKDTEYIKSGQEMLKQRTGICIDLFNLEYMPDEETERKQYMRKMFCIRKIMYAAMGRKNEKNVLLRAFYSVLYLIPKKIVYTVKTKICQKYNDGHTGFVTCTMFPPPNALNGYPVSLFDDFVEMKFEGMNFKVASGYDMILRSQYGDYMTLPPESQRKGVMNAVKYQLVDVQYEELKARYERENIKYE